MDPARVMCTFLRVWRKDWARLSRKQLAAAVSVELGRSIDQHVVRSWEMGQPPRTSEELQALGRVLSARGLTGWELDEVKDAVFAAVLARQYPTLFEVDDLIHSPGLDDFVESVVSRTLHLPIVDHVAIIHALETALQGSWSLPDSDPLRRRQTIALAHLKAWLVHRQQWVGRYALMGRMAEEVAGFLALTIGSSALSAECSVASMRRLKAFSLALSASPAAGVRRLRYLASDAGNHRQVLEAGAAYCQAVQFAGSLPVAEAEHLLARSDRVVAALREADPDGALVEPRSHLFEAEFSLGRYDAAEGYISELPHWRHQPGLHGILWHLAWGKLTAARGLWDEAEGYLSAAADLAAEGHPDHLREARRLMSQRPAMRLGGPSRRGDSPSPGPRASSG